MYPTVGCAASFPGIATLASSVGVAGGASALAPPAPYVVVLVEGSDAQATTSDLERRHGYRATHRYSTAFPGFAARLSGRLRDALAREPSVKSVHEDRPVRLVDPRGPRADDPLSTGVMRMSGGTKASGVAVAVLDTGTDALAPRGALGNELRRHRDTPRRRAGQSASNGFAGDYEHPIAGRGDGDPVWAGRY